MRLTKERREESFGLLRKHLVKLHRDKDENSLFCRLGEIMIEMEEMQCSLDSWDRMNALMIKMHEKPLEFLISVNGRTCLTVGRATASYEVLCKMAGVVPSPERNYTVMVSATSGARTVTAGQQCNIEQGMIVNVCYTGNA